MSDLIFANPGAPGKVRLIAVASVATLCLLLLISLWGRTIGTRSDIANLTAYLDQVDGRTDPGQGPSADQFYSAETLQLAQANVQTDLQGIAASHQIKIETIRADQIESAGSNIRLGLVVNGVVPEAALGSFLADIISHKPVIVIDALNLRRARAARSADKTRFIAFQMTLSGYAQR